ncbi:MAG: lysozyme [Pseudomonadota bacterium]
MSHSTPDAQYSRQAPTPRKPVFDTIRAILKRSFRQSEVDAIDDALDGMAPAALGKNRSKRGRGLFGLDSVTRVSYKRVGPGGVALIKRFEGCARLRKDGLIEAYPDPGTGAEPWTIGWGATGAGLEPGSRIGPGTVWTQKQCDARLAADLKRYARDVARAIGSAPTTQEQFDAMVSFHYNTGAIEKATLTKRHIAGDYEGAANEFKRWNKAGGRVLKGLTRRRMEEAQLYRKGQL